MRLWTINATSNDICKENYLQQDMFEEIIYSMPSIIFGFTLEQEMENIKQSTFG